ncbi:spheroidene monooxygenase [Mangrovivirga sp. M17]|uniref:Spheroidene monooxygenase n=1 Tax=Mangrovivirga halotolerans TaxID=2993936 RepID=A0ABT3RPR3_9BACT|nr:spheroidene monooxygenase [Mangrovivirga halotolerans]MCX2743595.1 spheroidene monooxygenase [Mangrovivirga halotolerans]
MKEITAITFMRFPDFKSRYKALTMMNEGHQYLSEIQGLNFYKLMGSGKGNGFNPFPDWSVYCLMTNWKDTDSATKFFNSSRFFNHYDDYMSEKWTALMKCVKSKGQWSGEEPFTTDSDFSTLSDKDPIAVLTRATIKTSKLLKFWSYVPRSSRALKNNSDIIFSKGVGEIPVVQMATFSIWKNLKSMKDFAYGSRGHKGAIKRTHKHDWYKEELFARFVIFDTIGSFSDIDLRIKKRSTINGGN